MYIHTYVWIYVHTYICRVQGLGYINIYITHTHAHTYVHIIVALTGSGPCQPTRTCVWECVQVCMYVRYEHIFVDERVCKCVQVCMYVKYEHTFVAVCVCKCVQVCTCVRHEHIFVTFPGSGRWGDSSRACAGTIWRDFGAGCRCHVRKVRQARYAGGGRAGGVRAGGRLGRRGILVYIYMCVCVLREREKREREAERKREGEYIYNIHTQIHTNV